MNAGRPASSINDVGVGGALIAETGEIDENRLLLGAGMISGQGPMKGHARYDGALGHDSLKHRGTMGVPYQFEATFNEEALLGAPAYRVGASEE
ncbi:hypothetical protein SAMN04488020_103157 [Palleronia marisminoris]|uniref:Uncharacterized protein n=1 Tax=Palleronia marisminoris TaxID=315423 RepID=A0A1Y5S7Q4_9RHOB|nr:hypothetical protein SAMN04488020_103157 [Palleronia marisminoris]SLN34359.1 hypothetical protein PAM7066_01437 [Palleronia marisminoris]